MLFERVVTTHASLTNNAYLCSSYDNMGQY